MSKSLERKSPRIERDSGDPPEKGSEFISELEKKFGALAYPVNPSEFSSLLRKSLTLNDPPNPHETPGANRAQHERTIAALHSIFGEQAENFISGGELQVDHVPLLVKGEDNQFYVLAFQPQYGNTERVEALQAEGRHVGGLAIYQLYPSRYFPEDTTVTDTPGLFLAGRQITKTVAPDIMYSPSNQQVEAKRLADTIVPSFHEYNEELLAKDKFLSKGNI